MTKESLNGLSATNNEQKSLFFKKAKTGGTKE